MPLSDIFLVFLLGSIKVNGQKSSERTLLVKEKAVGVGLVYV